MSNSSREREHLLRTIGALSLLLIEKTDGGRLGTREKLNKLGIHREINDILSKLDLSTDGQSKSQLNKVLSEALKITLEQ